VFALVALGMCLGMWLRMSLPGTWRLRIWTLVSAELALRARMWGRFGTLRSHRARFGLGTRGREVGSRWGIIVHRGITAR